MIDPLRQLGLQPTDCVAVVGGGDKRFVIETVTAAGCRIAIDQDDGGAPFSAPAPVDLELPAHGPGISAVVSVIGAGALGRVIADRCHRPLRIAALAGCSPYRRLTPVAAASVLLHERGARRVAPTARLSVAIVDVTAADGDAVAALVDELQRRHPGLPVAELPARVSDAYRKSKVAISRS